LARARILRGVVVSGRGLAAPVMSIPRIREALAKLTGLSMVPGTLNVELENAFKEELPVYVTVKELGGLPGVPNRKGLGSAE
jgi:CTP-dependent riboflavin kinase